MSDPRTIKVTFLGDLKSLTDASTKAQGQMAKVAKSVNTVSDANERAAKAGERFGAAVGRGFGKVIDGDAPDRFSKLAGGLGDTAGAMTVLGVNAEKLGPAGAIVQGFAGVMDIASVATGGLTAAKGLFVATVDAETGATKASTLSLIGNKVATMASAVAAKAAAVAQWALNAAMEANPIGLVVVAAAALAAGLIYAYKHCKTFREICQAAFAGISAAASFMWNDVLKPTFKFLVDAFLAVAGTIVHTAASAFGWIPGIGGKLKDAAKAFDKFRDDVNRSLDGVHKSVHVEVTGDFKAYGANAQGVATNAAAHGRAGGGPVRAGMPYIVGEHEPELFVPGASGRIYNSRQISGGGGIVLQVNFHGPTMGNGMEIAQTIQRELLRLKNLRGGELGLA